jgi:hypothetical protein
LEPRDAGGGGGRSWRAIQLHQVVLVLSKDSVESGGVENEIDMARRKERGVKRTVLYPITLDDSWRANVEASHGAGDRSRGLWRTLIQHRIIDLAERGHSRRRSESRAVAYVSITGPTRPRRRETNWDARTTQPASMVCKQHYLTLEKNK